MATLVLETAGTQEYTFDPADVRTRMADAYGPRAADEVSARMSPTSPEPAQDKEKV
jgi:adenosine kinase